MVTVVSWWFITTLVVLAGVTWVIAARRRRGRTRTAKVALVATAAVLSILTVADGVNAYFAYLPHLSDVAESAGGQAGRPSFAAVVKAGGPHPAGVVVRLPVPDLGSGFGRSDALVYLPPQYFSEPAARFPVVYLFHGSPGVPADWFEGGEAAQTADRSAVAGHPAIVVSPRMSHGWLDDPECVDGIHERVETHFVSDVVPTVDHRLRTLADRADRTLGGMSAGGYCALDLGLRHRDLAATVIDMSGLTEPTHTGGTKALFGTDPAVVAARTAATSPRVYAASLPAGPPLRIWFDVGRSDNDTRGPIEAIAPVLRADGVDVELHERAGAHTFNVWAPALREALPWALDLGAADRAA